MYRSEVHEALGRLALISGGTVAGLINAATSSETKVNAALREIAKNNDASVKTGAGQLQDAIKPLRLRVAEISPLGTARELDQLRVRFDGALSDFPDLEPLLRPGRQALAELSGAYDVVLQQHSRPPALADLIKPAMAFGREVALYATLAGLFNGAQVDQASGTSARIEIDGADRLSTFAAYVSWLSYLADIAGRLVTESSPEEPMSAELSIACIESGSPIQIQLKGGARVLRLVLAMVRDLVRVPYQHLTAHGRLIQTMETFAIAKELGINSPQVWDELQEAVLHASRHYSETIRGEAVAVVVDGERVEESATHALPPPAPDEPDEPNGLPRLPKPII